MTKKVFNLNTMHAWIDGVTLCASLSTLINGAHCRPRPNSREAHELTRTLTRGHTGDHGTATLGWAWGMQAFNSITRGVGFLLRSDLLAQLHKGDEPPSVKALQTVLRDYGSVA